MMAAREGREELTKVLMESGADPRSKNEWGRYRADHGHALRALPHRQDDRLARGVCIAVKAPKETFGPPTRSAQAPNEIEELLKKIRETEAQGLAADDLREQLWKAVNAFPAQRRRVAEFTRADAAAVSAQVHRDHRQARAAGGWRRS